MGATRPSHVVRFGNFDFDVETGDLWNNGRRSRLQEQPRQVLLMLLAHPGELVTRDALRTALWPNDTFVDFDAGVNVVVVEVVCVGGATGVVELPPQVLEATARPRASQRQRMRTPLPG